MPNSHLGWGPRDIMIRLYRMIKSDFWRKIFALFCALLVYYEVSNKSDGVERTIQVPVEIMMPQSYINMTPPSVVNVTLSGRSSFLNEHAQLNKLIMVVEVPELGAYNFREYRIRLQKENLKGLPTFGVQVADIRPSELNISLDKLETRTVEIIANYNAEQELPHEYTVTGVTMLPDKVNISGPESQVKDIKTISTEKIPLNGVTESFEYQAKLRCPEGMTLDRSFTRVRMEIGKEFDTRVMKSVAVRVLKSPATQDDIHVELVTPNVDVTLRAPKTRLALLKNTSIRPYIDISMLQESGVYMTEVYCWQDDETFSVVKIYPARVQIKLTKGK